MTWATTTQVIRILRECGLTGSGWDSTAIEPYIEDAENLIIGELADSYGLTVLTGWQAANPPAQLAIISAKSAAAEILNAATVYTERNEATISRMRKDVQETIERIRSGVMTLVSNGVLYHPSNFEGVIGVADGTSYDIYPENLLI